jgi:hypothetical protein
MGTTTRVAEHGWTSDWDRLKARNYSPQQSVIHCTVGSATSSPIGNPDPKSDSNPDVADDPRIFVTTFDGTNAIGHVLTGQQTDYQPALCAFQNDHCATGWNPLIEACMCNISPPRGTRTDGIRTRAYAAAASRLRNLGPRY